MGSCAAVGKREVAIVVQELSMRCDVREVPFPLDGRPLHQFIGLGKVTGTFVDAVSGESRAAHAVGTMAIAVSGGRMLGISAPLDREAAIWFASPVSEVRTEVLEVGGMMRKKPTKIRLSFDSMTIVMTEVDLLLKTMSQKGQAGTLLEELADRTPVPAPPAQTVAPPAGSPLSNAPVSRHPKPASRHPKPPSQQLAASAPQMSALPPDRPTSTELVDVGAGRLVLEVRDNHLPVRSALWSGDDDVQRNTAVDSLLRSLIEADYPERFIGHGFLEPLFRPGPLDAVEPIAAPWSDPLDPSTPTGLGAMVLPPTAISLFGPALAYTSLAAGDGPLSPWFRRLVRLAEAPPTRASTASLFRYVPPDPGEFDGWGNMSLGREETNSSLHFTREALVCRWTGEVSPEKPGAYLASMASALVVPNPAAPMSFTQWGSSSTSVTACAVVPTDTISEIQFKANFDAAETRRISDESKRLAVQRGYGVLKSIDTTITTHDGWRSVKVKFTVRPESGEAATLEALTWWTNEVVEARGAAAASVGAVSFPAPTLVKGVGTWMLGVLQVSIPGAMPFGCDRAELVARS